MSWVIDGDKNVQGVATTATPEQEEERNCVICMVNARDTTVLPCRHMCMCHDCAHELRKQTSKCPICRNHVESLLHIRMVRAFPASPLSLSVCCLCVPRCVQGFPFE